MKRKIIYYFAAAFMVLIIFTSGCTKDFQAINTNPNSPGINQAAPNMLLTNVIESMTDRVHEIFLGHEMGSCWVQHMAKVQYPDEDRYIPRMGVINNTWTSFYASSGYDAQTLYNIGVTKNNDSYKAVALILKSYIVSVLTDEFGDVPYSEAFMGSDATTPILSPVYDTQEAIYVALLANLAEANTLLSTSTASIEGDILYGNNLTQWRKFANSLSLRLLLRRSDRVNPTAAITAIVKDPAKYPVFTSSADNAALIYLGSAPNNNPINENRKSRDDHRVSKTIIDVMWTNNPNMDYRIAIYANRPSAGGWWEGLPNGMTSTDAANYKGNGLTKTSKIGSYFSAATAPGVLMSYAELQFILAESVQRGFITGSAKTAQDYYTEGVAGSYKQYADAIIKENKAISALGIDPAWTIDDFIADYMANYGAWDQANALKQIATEKWLAMFDQGLQSSFEWRRTGFPVLVPAIAGANGGKIPVRAYYPSDESGRNPTNLAAAITHQGADDLNTRVWWDTKNNY
ncbi:MAG: SusD/RagB family nutrient-binding outer membrane lipoprotein [Bacteroidota bacterium]|nr:SusD/RagB family nutrient-binding outer membrane lipoprotein [Bacteroidota bacterium]